MKAERQSDGASPEPEYAFLQAGGRRLRVAVWKASSSRRSREYRPILFFNGIGANIEVMAPLADWFPDRDLITFDMPGVGGSPKPVVPYRPWSMALTAAHLLDQLGYVQVDVMGVSWGGGLAQQFAFQHPKRTGRLVLAATSAGMIMVPGDISALSKMADPKRYVDPEFMRRNFETLYGGETAGSDGHIGRISPPSRTGYLYQLGAMAGWTSVPFLPFVKAPTLVLMGDADAIVPLVNGKFLAALIPKARLEVIADGGHLFLVTKAAQSAPMIRDFLDAAAVERSAAGRRAA
ncbi:MAG: alpha/beta fold hydrolase [Caulobacteraceae bacterium]|nr:alpha/beta fold hydrolase [Caulobacteraceae bacterium]